MKKHSDWQMIKKKLEGKLSVNEEQHFEKWLQKNPERRLMIRDLQMRWQKQGQQNEKVKRAYQSIKNKIEINERLYSKKGKSFTWHRIAASFLLIGLTSIIFFFTQETNSITEISYIEKSTVRGQTAVISLSDGSFVRLNSGSKLIYPEDFSAKHRKVFLYGEGYFEVKPEPERPFVVHAGEILTTVLGTSFNLRAVPSENTEITVNSGKVQVQHSQQESLLTYLVRGQQATFDPINNKIMTRQVEVEKYLAWMNRRLEFDKITFHQAMKQLARVYNLQVQINDKGAGDCLIRAVYQNERLENVLKGLQLIVKFDYEIINDSKLIINVDECIN